MYNLLVAGRADAWEGQPFRYDAERCVSEFTDGDLIERFAGLDDAAQIELQGIPCVFAYEYRCGRPPKFGFIRRITRLDESIEVEYEITSVEPFLIHKNLETGLDASAFQLGIEDREMNRTHWAVKDVDLIDVLKARGFNLPPEAYV